MQQLQLIGVLCKKLCPEALALLGIMVELFLFLNGIFMKRILAILAILALLPFFLSGVM